MGVARTTVQLIYNNARRQAGGLPCKRQTAGDRGRRCCAVNGMHSVPDADIAAAAAARNIKNKCRNEKPLLLQRFFRYFRDHIAVQRAFFFTPVSADTAFTASFWVWPCSMRRRTALRGGGKTLLLALLGLRLVGRTLEDEHELAARRVGVKGNRLAERHAERLLVQLGQLARVTAGGRRRRRRASRAVSRTACAALRRKIMVRFHPAECPSALCGRFFVDRQGSLQKHQRPVGRTGCRRADRRTAARNRDNGPSCSAHSATRSPDRKPQACRIGYERTGSHRRAVSPKPLHRVRGDCVRSTRSSAFGQFAGVKQLLRHAGVLCRDEIHRAEHLACPRR